MRIAGIHGVAAALGVWASCAAAEPEPKIVSAPPLAQESMATAGSPIFTTTAYYPMIGALRAARMKAGYVDITLDLSMVMMPSKGDGKIRACLIYEGRLSAACAVDEDGNGTFDRLDGKRLDQPVPYEQREVADPRHASVQSIYIYAGATLDSLRLTYREVTNERYRPDSDQEFSIPLGKSFPQQVAIRNLRITILSIDGLGIRYRIDK